MSGLYFYRLCSFIVAIALSVGVAALCVQTLGSQALTVTDSDRVFNVLYAYAGMIAGIASTVLLTISLICDSCHRPLTIVRELVLLIFPILAWIFVAVLTALKDGENFPGFKCKDTHPAINDLCHYATAIIGLSALVAILLALYSIVLLCFASGASNRGKPIWSHSVLRGSSQGQADLETGSITKFRV